ncbi:MAG TPA: thioredoxin [Candidatus Parcubacteria bacterium]|nr:thioredoxin [Candidatus Parcubacteria bacterium]
MLYLNDQNFEKELGGSQKPVLVDFYALWCAPCSLLSPLLEKLEKEFEKEVVFAKVNVDTAPLACQKYGINPIPTVILFKEGKPVDGFVGLQSEEKIRSWLKNHLNK